MAAKSPIPPMLLERLAAGEMPDDERRTLRDRYACTEDDLAQYIQEIHAHNQELLATYPASEFAKAVHNRLDDASTRASSPTPSRRSWWAIPAMLATAAAAWVFISPLMMPTPQPQWTDPADDVILLKGALPDTLKIWRAAQPENQRLEQGDKVRKGDTIQLEYVVPRDISGMIFSVDGRDVVTLHHPENARSAALLEQGTHLLPYSYTLDDAPDYERFFLVQCTHDVDASALLAHAKRFAAHATPDARRATFELPSDHDCTSHSMWLAKEAR